MFYTHAKTFALLNPPHLDGHKNKWSEGRNKHPAKDVTKRRQVFDTLSDIIKAKHFL